jgi:hypothetical protein
VLEGEGVSVVDRAGVPLALEAGGYIQRLGR